MFASLLRVLVPELQLPCDKCSVKMEKAIIFWVRDMSRQCVLIDTSCPHQKAVCLYTDFTHPSVLQVLKYEQGHSIFLPLTCTLVEEKNTCKITSTISKVNYKEK